MEVPTTARPITVAVVETPAAGVMLLAPTDPTSVEVVESPAAGEMADATIVTPTRVEVVELPAAGVKLVAVVIGLETTTVE